MASVQVEGEAMFGLSFCFTLVCSWDGSSGSLGGNNSVLVCSRHLRVPFPLAFCGYESGISIPRDSIPGSRTWGKGGLDVERFDDVEPPLQAG